MSTNFTELAEYFDAGDFSDEAKAAHVAEETTGTAGSTKPGSADGLSVIG